MWPLLALLVRSGAILLGAEMLRRYLRRSPAAQRHGLVLFAFALLFAWPLFSAILPSITVLWPSHAPNGEVEIGETFRMAGNADRPRVPIYLPIAIWMAGVLFTAGPLLYGFVRVRSLPRHAKRVAGTPLDGLLQESCRKLGIARVPELLLLEEPVMPMTFGLLRPKIVLPAACLTWTVVRQKAVVLHELAHVKRRDVASQLFAHLTTALWWFQPLSWMSRRSLRRESELACDQLVLSCGLRASDYAAELLAVAKDLQGTDPWAKGVLVPAGIAMVSRADLSERLYSILDAQSVPKNAALRRFAAALVSVLLLTVGASALTFSSEPITFPQPGNPQRSLSMRHSTLRHSVLSGLLTSAGLSAATIGGSLFDANGVPVSNAKASILNAETATKQEAATSPDGKFVFESLPAGEYILRIEKPGYPALYREFKVLEDSKVNRGLTLGAAEKQLLSRPDQLRIDGKVAQANLVTKVQPVYPASAKQAGIQGRVVLETMLSADGVPEDIRVVSSPSDDLTQSALEAVRQWRYTPALLNGEPIAVVTDITVNYTLSK